MTFDRRRIPASAAISMTPAHDGWPLRTYVQPACGAAKGSILWLGGRGDIVEKYLESIDAWTRAGWNVTSFDWRGQGGSGRSSANPHVGHAPAFAPWIDDLAAFSTDWKARTPGPHIVMGHSMGGHLVLRALAEKRIAPDKAVLIAPMLGFDSGLLPFAVASGMARMLSILTRATRPAWKRNEKPAPRHASRQGFLTHDDNRYADELWWKDHDPVLTLGPPSWAWVAAAYRSIARLRRPGAIEAIATPILIVGTDGDELVSPSAIRTFAARLPNAALRMFGTDVAHEILRERDGPRDEAMAAIADFLG